LPLYFAASRERAATEFALDPITSIEVAEVEPTELHQSKRGLSRRRILPGYFWGGGFFVLEIG
jgi:hypothetical protein